MEDDSMQQQIDLEAQMRADLAELEQAQVKDLEKKAELLKRANAEELPEAKKQRLPPPPWWRWKERGAYDESLGWEDYEEGVDIQVEQQQQQQQQQQHAGQQQQHAGHHEAWQQQQHHHHQWQQPQQQQHSWQQPQQQQHGWQQPHQPKAPPPEHMMCPAEFDPDEFRAAAQAAGLLLGRSGLIEAALLQQQQEEELQQQQHQHLLMLRAERSASERSGLSWQQRGPPGPDEGGPQTWRGQRYRPLSRKWTNRGGDQGCKQQTI